MNNPDFIPFETVLRVLTPHCTSMTTEDLEGIAVIVHRAVNDSEAHVERRLALAMVGALLHASAHPRPNGLDAIMAEAQDRPIPDDGPAPPRVHERPRRPRRHSAF